MPIEALFASWRPSLFRYARRLCGAADVAEDMVQEAFLALCRKLAEGEDLRDPRQWTLCVVRYQVSKRLRDRERHGEELHPPQVLDAVATRGAFAACEPRRDMHQLLSVLSPREREVILLRMESLKYHQIAARLGISPKTIGALLARALRKLQRAAEDCPEWAS